MFLGNGHGPRSNVCSSLLEIGMDSDGSDSDDFASLGRPSIAPDATLSVAPASDATVAIAGNGVVALRHSAADGQRKRKWARLGVPGHSVQRSKVEHMLVCERMRARKAERRAATKENEFCELASAFVLSCERSQPQMRRTRKSGGGKNVARKMMLALAKIGRGGNALKGSHVGCTEDLGDCFLPV